MPPTSAKGKICYIEPPAANVQRSADFYRDVSGWSIRRRGGGAPEITARFRDPGGNVIGLYQEPKHED